MDACFTKFKDFQKDWQDFQAFFLKAHVLSSFKPIFTHIKHLFLY
jgi:hypothetical protein